MHRSCFTYESACSSAITADVVAIHLGESSLIVNALTVVEGADLIERLLRARDVPWRALLGQITDALDPSSRYVVPDFYLGTVLARSEDDQLLDVVLTSQLGPHVRVNQLA